MRNGLEFLLNEDLIEQNELNTEQLVQLGSDGSPIAQSCGRIVKGDPFPLTAEQEGIR